MNRGRGRDRRRSALPIALAFLWAFAGAFDDVLEYREPGACERDEYFDGATLSCARCNASRHLELTANRKSLLPLIATRSSLDPRSPVSFVRSHPPFFLLPDLRCTCDRYSRTLGYENGNPLCAPCDPGAIATADGRDCVRRANVTCDCSSNQIRRNHDQHRALSN